MTTINEHDFEILKDSKTSIEATARFSKNMKLTYVGDAHLRRSGAISMAAACGLCLAARRSVSRAHSHRV